MRRYLLPIPATRHVGWLGIHANDEVPSADPTSKTRADVSSELEEKSCAEDKEEWGRGLSEEALVTSQTMMEDPALHFSRPWANWRMREAITCSILKTLSFRPTRWLSVGCQARQVQGRPYFGPTNNKRAMQKHIHTYMYILVLRRKHTHRLTKHLVHWCNGSRLVNTKAAALTHICMYMTLT